MIAGEMKVDLDQRITALEARIVALEYAPITFNIDTRALTIGARTVTLPIPLYRGVWEPGRTYLCGDVTTHRGHAWIAKYVITQASPGTCPDWQLMIKKGRDAR